MRGIMRWPARLALLVMTVVATGPAWLPTIGEGLVVQDPVAPADAIVVLAGNAPERLRHGLELYQAGLAPYVVVSNERVRAHGLDTTWLALYRRGLSAPALPAHALLVLDDPVPESTLDEARRVAALLEARGLRSAILVTDTFHSRRSSLMFGAAFRQRGLHVVSSPASDETLDLSRWWEHPRTARTVVQEYLKLAVYLPQGVYW